MTQLSVNVNKIATLRNSRGKNLPNVLQTILDIISYGAQGITVHPRPDERHIRREDVYQLARHIKVELNIEGYPSRDFLNLIKAVKPAQCTLVPDPPHVLTSQAGWHIEQNLSLLTQVIAELHAYGVRSSLFIDPHTLTQKEIHLLKATQTDRVELYTESYADAYGTSSQASTLALYKQRAQQINELGIVLNAGHDLNLTNLALLIKEIPTIEEVSIGHALICDALYFGLEETIRRYLACLA